jgi:hypothetical protein
MTHPKRLRIAILTGQLSPGLERLVVFAGGQFLVSGTAGGEFAFEVAVKRGRLGIWPIPNIWVRELS